MRCHHYNNTVNLWALLSKSLTFFKDSSSYNFIEIISWLSERRKWFVRGNSNDNTADNQKFINQFIYYHVLVIKHFHYQTGIKGFRKKSKLLRMAFFQFFKSFTSSKLSNQLIKFGNKLLLTTGRVQSWALRAESRLTSQFPSSSCSTNIISYW